MFKQFFNHSFSVFIFSEFIFFNADLDRKNSALHFSCPVSVWSHIFILLKVIFREIDTLLTTSWSDTKVSNCFSPIVSKSSITVLIVSGTIFFLLLRLMRWYCINRFAVMHLIIPWTFEKNLSWKCRLSSWCLLLDSARISFQSRQSLNSSITRAISGLQVSQKKIAIQIKLYKKTAHYWFNWVLDLNCKVQVLSKSFLFVYVFL